jgi:hypothetical protein
MDRCLSEPHESCMAREGWKNTGQDQSRWASWKNGAEKEECPGIQVRLQLITHSTFRPQCLVKVEGATLEGGPYGLVTSKDS